MEQTTQEKLRLIADALDAGEEFVLGPYGNVLIGIAINNLSLSETISRIPAQIKVGNRTINAPLRVMPKEGDKYWVSVGNEPFEGCWDGGEIDRNRFNAANCWATEQDAQAYVDAALAVRKGEV